MFLTINRCGGLKSAPSTDVEFDAGRVAEEPNGFGTSLKGNEES